MAGISRKLETSGSLRKNRFCRRAGRLSPLREPSRERFGPLLDRSLVLLLENKFIVVEKYPTIFISQHRSQTSLHTHTDPFHNFDIFIT